MATVAIPSLQTANFSSLFSDWKAIPESQGVEGRQIQNVARDVARHWAARPSLVLESCRAKEDFGYEPIPLKLVGATRVTYSFIGRLEPRPYPSDD
jgi:hypothetical protein